MSSYRAPLRDMRFVLHELADIDAIGKLPGYEEARRICRAIIDRENGAG